MLVVSKHKHYHANPLLKPDPNVNLNQAEKKRSSQFNAMLDDVFLLLDDLVLLRMVSLGNWDAGGDGGV